MEKIKNENELLSELGQFIGTLNYFRHYLKTLVYTDGVRYLAEKIGAFWLLDIVASHQLNEKVKQCPFQLWTIDVDIDKSATITMREDTNTKPIIQQKIPYTDFPMKHFKWYVGNGFTDNKTTKVMMLPSEY